MTRDHDDLDRHLRRIAQALVDDGSARHSRSWPTIPTIPAGPPARRRTAAWLGAAAASIAVAGVAGLIAFGGHPPSRAPGASPTTTSIVGPAVVVPTTSCPDAPVDTTAAVSVLNADGSITVHQCLVAVECRSVAPGSAPVTVITAAPPTAGGSIPYTGGEISAVIVCGAIANCDPADSGPAPVTVMEANTTTSIVELEPGQAVPVASVDDRGADECFAGPALDADGIPIATVRAPELTTIVMDHALPESRFSQTTLAS